VKVYMFVDMEGITGIYRTDHDPAYENQLQVSDVNAAVEGALAGGASEVLVQIAHGRTQPFDLHPKASFLGKGQPFGLWGMDGSFACLLHVGCHARAGAWRGVLAHTVSGDVFELSLNNVVLGETGIFAAMAGQLGVPTALVTGDDVTCQEARELLGDIEVAEVKRGLAWDLAICLPVEETARLIRTRAEAAVRRAKEIPPYRVQPPFVVRTVFNTWRGRGYVDHKVIGTLCRRLDERTLEVKSDNLAEAFALSW